MNIKQLKAELTTDIRKLLTDFEKKTEIPIKILYANCENRKAIVFYDEESKTYNNSVIGDYYISIDLDI